MGFFMAKKKKSPFFYILLLTLISLLPFVAFMFDRILVNMDTDFLLIAEIFVFSGGILIAFLLFLFIK